ncbi:glycosyltransferase family 4 protein [uncultured Methanobacterium sp.]|uniref:glycosyltransferase family 4 protein n=1 Tax=uncultured Methanobacterium sp. TaxID=176306 RepID=UPI002AA606F9|nr:glycosyltransferase family 4 protein [uncultured Methanobacterium sp.]
MSEKLKIAIFHNLPSGGAKRALHGFVKYLSTSGHTVDLYIPETANEEFLPLEGMVRDMHVFPVKKSWFRSLVYSTFSYVPAIFKPISIKNVDQAEKAIAQTINQGDYDVVFSEQDQFVMAPYFLKYIEKPTVYYCQQPPRREKILEKISEDKRKKRLLEPLIKRYINHVIAGEMNLDLKNVQYSRYMIANSYYSHESILRSYGLNSYVSYLGVDVELFKPLGLPREDFVLSVGTCIPPKGYDFIINSLARVDEKVRPKLIIVSNMGDEQWKDYLREMATNLGVDLEILRGIDDDKLVSLYNRAKMVLYAPYLEPFGLVPLEAMACGTPVVAVKEGGVRETVIHNENGFLTQRDEMLFAEAVTQLLDDEEKRIRLAQNALEMVQRDWSLESAGERLVDHLKRSINGYD